MNPLRRLRQSVAKTSFKAGFVLAGSIAGLLVAPAGAANTVNHYTGSVTGSFLTPGNWNLGTAPGVTNDAVFPLGAATGIRTLSAGTLTLGSLNVLPTAGTFSLRNEATDATNSTLTLGGVGSTGNSVSGNFSDLLYVNTGATLNLLGTNGGGGTGVMSIALGQTGSFNVAGTAGISATISGAGFGFNKTGAGALTLNPTSVNTYTGPTSVTGGTLTLDYTGLATATNLINSSSSLTIGGTGTLSILGKTTGLTAQTFAGTTVNAGGSVITLSRNAGTSATLTMGAITRNAGGVLAFRPATAWSNTASTTEIATTTGINGGALPGATSFIGAWAFGGTGTGTRLLQLTPTGQFVLAPGATAATAGTFANVTSTSTVYSFTAGATLAANQTAYGLIANAATAATVATGASTLTLNSLLNIAAGTVSFTGTGGIVVGAENELVINAAAGAFTMTTPISNKPASASMVTITGNTTPANVSMGAQHTYTGGTTITNPLTTVVPTVSSTGGTPGNPTTGPFGSGPAPLNLAGAQIRATTGAATTIGNTVTISADTIFPTTATEKTLTFTGPVTLTGGSRLLTASIGATVNTESLIFSGAIGDGGNGFGITKAGTGPMRLSGANTYTGPTVITAGTLQIGNGGTTGALSPNSPITNNATLSFNRTNTVTQGTDFANVIAGTGAVNQLGSGTLVLNGANTFTGNVTIAAGTIQITNSAALGTGTKTVTINSGVNKFLDLDGTGGDITLASGISFQTSGVNGVIRNIAGNNTINGAVTMTSGNGNTKIISNGGTLTLAGNFTSSSTLRVLDLAGTSTGANTFSGSLDNVNVPALTKSDAGTWILSGASTYAGTTTVSDGTLKAGSTTGFSAAASFVTANTATALLDLNGFDSTVGSLAGGGTTGGNVLLGSSTLTAGADNTSTTYAGVLSGTGGNLTKIGAGALNLTGANTYTGTTTITNGALLVNNTLASTTINVGATGTLGGAGPIAGTVNASGTISPATSTTPGTLTIGTLTLNSGTALSYEFGGTSDLVTVTAPNGLTINGGALSLFATGGVAPLTTDGTYTLFNYSTAIQGSVGNLTIANPQLNKFYQISDTLAGTITLTLSTTTTSNWTGGASDGLWTTSGNWSAGTPNSAGSVATLGSIPLTPTSIAVDGAKTVGSLLFDHVNAYTVTGGATDTLTFNNGIAAGIVNVASGSHTISAPVALASNLSVSPAMGTALAITGVVSGTNGLTKNDAGTLTLSGANTFTGPVTISGGVLAVGSVANGGAVSPLGQSTSAAANLVLDGGTLQYTGADASTDRNFTIATGKTGTIEVTNGATTLILTGAAASTSGALAKTGPGKLVVTAAQAYTGATTISAGVLNIQNAGALGTAASGTTVASGAALELAGGIAVGPEALTLSGDGIGGAGALRSLSGVNSLAGLVTLAGNTRINTDADSLNLSNAGTITGAGFGLTIGGAGNTAIGSIIGTGTGTVTKDGSGTLTLSRANTYTGNTTLLAGVLRATSNAGALGAGALVLSGGELQLANDTALNFARNVTLNTNLQIVTDTLTPVAGVTHTLGTLAIGANTLTISKGPNATGTTARVAFGATTLSGNPLFSIGTGASISLGAVTNGTNNMTFTGAGNVAQSGAWGSGSGNVIFDAGFTGTAILNQANTFTGDLIITSGTVTSANAAAITTANAITIGDSTGATTTPATLDATSANFTFTKPINVVGTNQVNTIRDTSNVASFSGAITLTNASLVLNNATSAAQVFSGGFTGTGNLTISNTNGGAAGSITISTAAVNHTGSITNNSTGPSASTLLISADIGTNVTGLTQNSTVSRTTLTGANTYTGPTLISAGILQIGNAGATGSLSPSSSITNNATLAFSRTNTVTQGTDFAAGISGTGAITQTGGVLVLNAANTYDGLTTVNTGTIVASHANALGSAVAGTVVVAGASVQVSGGATISSGETISIAGTGVSNFGALQAGTGGGTWAGQVTLDAAGVRVGAIAGETLTITGPIVGGLTQDLAISGAAGTGVVVVNPATANTYTGTTGVIRGILRLGKTDALPTSTLLDVDSFAAVTDTSAFDLAGFNQTVGGLRTSATSNINGRITNSVAATSSTLTVNNSAAFTYGTSLIENGAGSVAVTKTGGGVQTFTGANTYSGTTTVNGGTLKAGILSVANVSGAFGNNSPVVMGNVAGATLDITGFSTQIGSLTGGGALGGNVTLGAATLTVGGDNSSPGAYGGIISGTGAVTKIGTGTLTLIGVNTFTGKTVIANGSVSIDNVSATATANQALGANAAVDLGVAATSAGSLVYTGGANTLAKAINVLGNGTNTVQNSGSGLLTLSGAITKSGTTLALRGGTNGIEVTGVIGGAAANSDLVIDAGVTTLSNANTYDGPTFITNGGTLHANAINALPTANGRSAIGLDQTGSGGSTLALGANQSVASLSGLASSTVNLNGNNLTVGASSGTTVFAGSITGAGGLTKDTAGGTQTLSGNGPYTGPTRVFAGTLEVSGSLAGTSDLTLDGGNLLLTGTSGAQINNSATVTLNGGVLGFGNLANQTESLGALILSSSSTLDFGIAGGNDTFLFLGLPNRSGGVLTIDNWAGSPTGGVDGVDDRLVFLGNVADFTGQFTQESISFTGYGSGYAAIDFGGSYEIVPVPESSTAALFGTAGLLGLVGHRERRRFPNNKAMWS